MQVEVVVPSNGPIKQNYDNSNKKRRRNKHEGERFIALFMKQKQTITWECKRKAPPHTHARTHARTHTHTRTHAHTHTCSQAKNIGVSRAIRVKRVTIDVHRLKASRQKKKKNVLTKRRRDTYHTQNSFD